MTYQDGKFYYKIYGKMWKICKCHIGKDCYGQNTYTFAPTGEEYWSADEARARVYELNGWRKK